MYPGLPGDLGNNGALTNLHIVEVGVLVKKTEAPSWACSRVSGTGNPEHSDKRRLPVN